MAAGDTKQTFQLDEKRRAILVASGHLLVTGGPGCGKTTIALLKARERTVSLLPGQEILFLSFSRAAVRQVLARAKNVLKHSQRSAVSVKTYHAFCMEVLHAHGRLLAGKRVRFLTPDAERLARSDFEGKWDEEVRRLAQKEGLLAFDTFAQSVADLFSRAKSVRRLYTDKYPLIIVDEFQDTDDDQWRIVQSLSEGSVVCALADPDQRIFDYRPKVSPERLQQLRETIRPTEFDFGQENNRSPGSGILAFADAVLGNRVLPATEDVRQIPYPPTTLAVMVHVSVLWSYSVLRKRGVAHPVLAVLCKTNALVAQVSAALNEEHTFKDSQLAPIAHEVLWDAELVGAAGQVIASILEWHDATDTKLALGRTVDLIAHYYRLKNAERPSAVASTMRQKLRVAADAIRAGKSPAVKAVKQLAQAVGLSLGGDPVADWKTARGVLEQIKGFAEVAREARLLRLFRATDVIGVGLATLWRDTGTYRDASSFVKRVLDEQRVTGAESDHRGCILMNMHKSKGKEFDGVVIVEGEYSGAFFNAGQEQPPFVKTRRLLRVAITRARSFVTLVRPRRAAPLTTP